MDAYGGVKVLLGGTQPHAQDEPLGDLTRIRAHIVETNHPLLYSGCACGRRRGVWLVVVVVEIQ